MKPGVESQPPYPIYRAAKRVDNGLWPKKDLQPELVPASLNPMKRDSQSMPKIPRGPWEEQVFPGNARDWAPKDQRSRNKRVLPGMQPTDAGGCDSSILLKYGVGYNNLQTAHPTDTGTRGGISTEAYEKIVKQHTKRLSLLPWTQQNAGRQVSVEILPQSCPQDSSNLRKHAFGRADLTYPAAGHAHGASQ